MFDEKPKPMGILDLIQDHSWQIGLATILSFVAIIIILAVLIPHDGDKIDITAKENVTSYRMHVNQVENVTSSGGGGGVTKQEVQPQNNTSLDLFGIPFVWWVLFGGFIIINPFRTRR